MPNTWPLVPLGELLNKSDDWISIKPDEKYRQVTVKLWGQGVVLRNEVTGAEIAASTRLRVRAQQFILSRIDARNGALGLVPDSLDGGVVSSDFPVFTPNRSRILFLFLNWLSKTAGFVDLCKAASEGTTNRVRLKEDKFLALNIPLPPLDEQRRIVARIEALAAKIEEARYMRIETQKATRLMLLAAFSSAARDATWLPIGEVAPLKRRPVSVDFSMEYRELGIRSFGKGTFHKPPLTGAELGTKKMFAIEPHDLLFNIVFAWEGAVAVAKPEDAGRVGSHRFLTCVPNEGVATSAFLCFHFLTANGLEQLGEASPGGAGRNRTLGLEGLEGIKVPVPPFEKQMWFDSLASKMGSVSGLRAETAAELDALLPSILDKAFRGEL